MKIQHAKIILSSFRPDGMDAQDVDFTEALQLAAEDRELGEWLAVERARDAQFAKALMSIKIPDDLREDILASIAGDVEIPEDLELDSTFFGAVNSVIPPKGLRDQILVAMDKEDQANAKVVRFSLWKVLPLAAAAVVALCVAILMPRGEVSKNIVVSNEAASPVVTVENHVLDVREGISTTNLAEMVKPMGAYDIQRNVGRQLINENIQLVSNSYQDSMKWLEAKQLPTVDIPETLKNMRCVGCTVIDLGEGVEASMVRFLTNEGKEVNLLVVAEQYVKDNQELPNCKIACKSDSYFCPECKYWIARMKAEGSVVILLSKLDQEHTVEIF